MTDKKNLKSIYGGPVREKVKYPILKQIITVIGFIVLGLAVPIVGLPVAFLLKDQKHSKASLLLITSIIGFILFVGIMFYGWFLHMNISGFIFN